MRRQFTSAIPALLAILAAATSAAPNVHAGEKDDLPAVVARSESAARKLAGMYRPDRNPSGVVTISSFGYGMLTVTGGVAWESVGFLDEGVYRGVLRAPSGQVAASSERSYGELRFSTGSDGSIKAEIKMAPALMASSETWTRIGGFGEDVRQEPAPASAADGEALPEFGAYVHVEELPEPLRKVPPRYPEAARSAGIQGVVMVQALIGRDGRVKDTRIVKSIPGLDEAAIEAVKYWEFKAAQSQGKPVAVWVAIPVSFRLH